MIDTRDEIPILLRSNLYFDQNGQEHTYEDTSKYSEAINTYLYMEYNNLQKKRKQFLFNPYPVSDTIE